MAQSYPALIHSRHRKHFAGGGYFDYEEIDYDTQGSAVARADVGIGVALVGAISDLADDFLQLSERDLVARYEEYLLSPHWLVTRTRMRRRANYTCQRCNADGVRIDVHHLTYARLGAERDSDLVALCKRCHAREHGRAVL